MKKFLQVGNQILIDVDDILSLCPITAVPHSLVSSAVDVSTGSKRTIIFTKSGIHFAVGTRHITLNKRLQQLLAE